MPEENEEIAAHVDDPNDTKRTFKSGESFVIEHTEVVDIGDIPRNVAIAAMIEASKQRKEVPLVYYRGVDRIQIGTAIVTPQGILAEVSAEHNRDVAALMDSCFVKNVSMSFDYPPQALDEVKFVYPERVLPGHRTYPALGGELDKNREFKPINFKDRAVHGSSPVGYDPDIMDHGKKLTGELDDPLLRIDEEKVEKHYPPPAVASHPYPKIASIDPDDTSWREKNQPQRHLPDDPALD